MVLHLLAWSQLTQEVIDSENECHCCLSVNNILSRTEISEK